MSLVYRKKMPEWEKAAADIQALIFSICPT
jgi:hypothetical protein